MLLPLVPSREHWCTHESSFEPPGNDALGRHLLKEAESGKRPGSLGLEGLSLGVRASGEGAACGVGQGHSMTAAGGSVPADVGAVLPQGDAVLVAAAQWRSTQSSPGAAADENDRQKPAATAVDESQPRQPNAEAGADRDIQYWLQVLSQSTKRSGGTLRKCKMAGCTRNRAPGNYG